MADNSPVVVIDEEALGRAQRFIQAYNADVNFKVNEQKMLAWFKAAIEKGFLLGHRLGIKDGYVFGWDDRGVTITKRIVAACEEMRDLTGQEYAKNFLWWLFTGEELEGFSAASVSSQYTTDIRDNG